MRMCLPKHPCNPDLFPELNIPRSTIAGWLRGEFKPAVGSQAISQTEAELHARLSKLERRVQILLAVVRLLLALVRVSGCRLTGDRLPDGKAKADILRAVDAARKTLPLRAAVRVLGLSLSRYHAWKRAERACDLTDRSSCPKTYPGQLTAQEAGIIQEMVSCNRDFYSIRRIVRRVFSSLWHRRKPLISLVGNLSYRGNIRTSDKAYTDFRRSRSST